MKYTEDICRKESMARELYFLLGAAGVKVENVEYKIISTTELYIVRMRDGTEHKVNVTADSPMTAAYDFINHIRKRV